MTDQRRLAFADCEKWANSLHVKPEDDRISKLEGKDKLCRWFSKNLRKQLDPVWAVPVSESKGVYSPKW